MEERSSAKFLIGGVLIVIILIAIGFVVFWNGDNKESTSINSQKPLSQEEYEQKMKRLRNELERVRAEKEAEQQLQEPQDLSETVI